jgi:hypothetical protein
VSEVCLNGKVGGSLGSDARVDWCLPGRESRVECDGRETVECGEHRARRNRAAASGSLGRGPFSFLTAFARSS